MTKNRATILALFIAPVVPAAYFASVTQIASHPNIIEKLEFFPIYYIFTIAFMAIFGVPLILIGISRNLISWWSAAIAGSSVGVIFGLSLNQHGMYLMPPSALGAVTGLTFWLIWRIGHDEQVAKKSEPPTPKSAD